MYLKMEDYNNAHHDFRYRFAMGPGCWSTPEVCNLQITVAVLPILPKADMQ